VEVKEGGVRCHSLMYIAEQIKSVPRCDRCGGQVLVIVVLRGVVQPD